MAHYFVGLICHVMAETSFKNFQNQPLIEPLIHISALKADHMRDKLKEVGRLWKKYLDLIMDLEDSELYKTIMSSQTSQPHRAVVEHWVRQAVYQRMGQPVPQVAQAPNPLVVNISARHCHLTQEAVDALFGAGHQLSVHKWLYQDGQFAAKETITLVGPRSRVISNLRILGPCRSLNQVELAYTDAVALGFDIPLRSSGDIAQTPGAMLMGPNGFFEMDSGVIRALRHVHMHPEDARFYQVSAGDFMTMKVGGACGVQFEQMLVRVDPSFKLEVHIDTDEGNACNLLPTTSCELIKV